MVDIFTPKHIIYSLFRYTKLEKLFFVVEHGTITVRFMYTSIKGFIFIEQNGRGFLSLQGYSGLILPLLFDLLVGKITRIIYTVSREKQKKT